MADQDQNQEVKVVIPVKKSNVHKKKMTNGGNNKTNSGSKRNRLQQILDSRKVKRDGWDQEKRDNYIQFLVRLKTAHDNYVTVLSKKIVECAENIQKKNDDSQSFKLWDPQNIKCDLKGFSEFTIYRGFWNGEKKKHDRLPHMEAGIKATPIVEVTRSLRSSGYLVKDVSDVNLSLHIVIEITMVPKEEDNGEQIHILAQEVVDDEDNEADDEADAKDDNKVPPPQQDIIAEM